MFGFFNRSTLKNLQKQQQALLTRAFQAQRNGNIRQYSSLTAEAEALSEKIKALKIEQGQ
jgi:hypothetical protein